MLDYLKRFPQKDPLVLIGILTSIGTAIQQNTANGHVDWPTVAPIIVTLVLRNFVTSPATAAELKAAPADPGPVVTGQGNMTAGELP